MSWKLKFLLPVISPPTSRKLFPLPLRGFIFGYTCKAEEMSSKIEVNFLACNQPIPPISRAQRPLPGLSFIFFFTYFICFICNCYSLPKPNICNRHSLSLSKMFIAAASACAVTMIRLLHSCEKYVQQEPPLSLPSSRKYLPQPPVKLPKAPFRPSPMAPTPKYPFFPMSASPLIINENPSVAIIPPPNAKHGSSGKVRILCRFGGKLLRGFRDGALHYVGGKTCMTDFRRDITLQEFNYKMEDVYGGPTHIRYKLCDKNQDTFVSILTAEDLDNMLDEYDYLLEAPEGRYPILEVFLFPPSNRENSLADACKIYGEDNIKGSTISGYGEGNDNTSMPEDRRFSSQIGNQPYDIPHISPTYTPFPLIFSMSLEDQHLSARDLWNDSGPSNNFEHFRLAQDLGIDEDDEDFQNVVGLVEFVLQSP